MPETSPESSPKSQNEPASASTGRRVTRHGAGVAAALAATAVLVVVGIVALVLGLRGSSGAPGSPQQAVAASTPSRSTSPSTQPATRPSASPGQGGTPATTKPGASGSGGSGIGDFLEASEPTSLEIPSIGVRSTHFVPLSIQRNGTISVPGTAQEVGLYDAGPTPGQLGPSVLAAHVDTPSGVPGIFHELRRVKVGDVVKVTRQDGSHLTFTVDRVQAFEKTQFPTELVYRGDFTQAEIRLVTCGGPTDSRNEYRDNVVVFGHLTSST